MSEEQEADDEKKVSRLEKEIDKLKAEVQSSSDEMKRTVEDLKKAVVDIRSAVSEIENPFNLLRIITNEKDLEKVSKTSLNQPVIEKIQIAEKEETPRIEGSKKEEREGAEVTPKKPEEKAAENGEQISLETWPLEFKDAFSLIQWIYNMFDMGFSGEDLKRICQYCEHFRMIPEGSSIHISGMIDALADARSKGFSEEDIMLILYMAAEAFGVEVEKKIIRELAVNVLKRNKLRRLRG
ncbi:hypothetical protein CW706_04455 [Candidatus Bathyarchaeota archaeon]|nr:MAG: hypothetical protein CW706_04455 [Candidatus Bathyarchaeota archaeon]